MPKLIFVMGATATGKTHFIKTQFSGSDYEILNVYDYQNRLYDEAGVKDTVSFSLQKRILWHANKLIQEDIFEKLSKGQDVVVEHTLFKAKRRIVYTDEMKKIPDVTMEIYVMQPTKAQWESNIKKRELSDSVQRIMGDAEVIEFPNPAEGFDAIYEVVDGQIKLRMEESRPEILEPARKEIQEETEEILTEEKLQKERKQLMESMETRKFWHYCEGCGKKEFLTADEAHEAGWDYPPRMGHFGLLSPRTCGNCVITSTLYWKVATGGGLPIVFEEELTPEEKVTWNRIKNEPESLLEEE